MLNDGARRTFEIEGDPAVRQIVVRDDSIRSLTFRLLSGAAGTVGYGAIFEEDAGGGVCVDNYSIRSNNGQAMFRTDPSVNAQIDALLSYDLVVLQYGLNIMQSGVKGYGGYGAQIEKMIAYVRECFPGAAVLVMGVSDRSVRTDGGFEPMDAIPYMTACQRRAAQHAGAAFWPTAEAMRSLGGMAQFVRNGWAGKDFTHINYAGGRRVAELLFDAVNARTAALHAAREAEERRRRAEQSVLDSLGRVRIEDRLLPAAPHVFAVGLPTIATDTPPARHGTKSTHDDPPGHRQPPRASRGAARLRRLVAADLQQRPLSVPFRRLHARLRRAAPRDDGPHRLRDPLLALLLLQVERHLLSAADLRRDERLPDRPGAPPHAAAGCCGGCGWRRAWP